MDILEKFLEYVKIDTTSNSKVEGTPSTIGQLKFAKMLVKDLEKLNISDIYFDSKHCYIYGVLKGKSYLPKIGFVSHIDTSEDEIGKDINPIIIPNYDGSDIVLDNDKVLSVKEYPDLKNHIGKTLITSKGYTLLGADDKAGIVEIMKMLEYFANKEEEHGDILICFTPDEEIGKGTLHFDKKYFNPDFAYTVDGSSLGEFSYENFNAASAKIKIKGVSTHCGSGKGKMINAVHLATMINFLLPDEIPWNTEKYEGFFHLEEINGDVSNATMEYLIRDFDKENFNKRKQKMIAVVSKLNEIYNNRIKLEIKDTYYNMYEIISRRTDLIEKTMLAIKNVGVTPEITPTRGGTDGTVISYLGIPCPNLGTGGYNFHSIYEYICLEDMEKVSEILISIVKEFTKKDVKTKKRN